MSKHTPGPWHHIEVAIPYRGFEILQVVPKGFGPGVGRCVMRAPNTRAEDEANAKLIAAAPNLLAIAQGVIVALQYPRGSEAQVRCLEEVGQDAKSIIDKL